MILPDGEPEVVRLPATAGVDLAARVERINLTRLGAAGAGSMLVDQSRAEAWDGELDELVSTSIDDDAVDARLRRSTPRSPPSTTASTCPSRSRSR